MLPIVVVCFNGVFCFVDVNTSISVGSGMPKRDGSSSCNSMNSLRHIFSASLLEIGGEWGPTDTAWHGSSTVGFKRAESSTCNHSSGAHIVFVVVVAADTKRLARSLNLACFLSLGCVMMGWENKLSSTFQLHVPLAAHPLSPWQY